MNRLLLTLLALLTGLAAQVSPAAAATRSVGETEIGVTETQIVRHVAASAVVAMARATCVQAPTVLAQLAPAAQSAVPVRSVLTGIDRARE